MNAFFRLVSRVRRHRGLRYAGLGLAICLVVLIATVLATLTIDLGPVLRARAEREGSKRVNRPIHIGSLTLRLLRGRVELNDFAVDGLQPGDRPFFSAKRLSLSLDWTRALARRPEFIITSVEMTDWQMLVEKFKGRDSFPRLPSPGPPTGRPSRFTTTLRSLRAWRGHFIYEDHELPWSVDAPNIDINITNRPNYNGTASFTGGMVAIQQYVPMWTNFKTRFSIEKSLIVLSGIEIETDGGHTVGSGVVDAAHWPEQTYQLQTRLQFPRMRELFFAKESWVLSGDGDFTGTFHLFNGGHDLAGTFKSDVAGLYDYRFPSLNGSLHWTRNRFDVTDAGAKFMGGDARFAFAIAPLGAQTRPDARFEASYQNLDLARLSDFYRLPGLRMAGRGTGSNLLEWPLGRFGEHTGEGRFVATPPDGVATMTGSLPAAGEADLDPGPSPGGRAAPPRLTGHEPVAAEVSYRFGPEVVELGPSRFATERTHVSFAGTTAWGGESAIQFHVTSGDWQESDQVLAAIMTDFGAPTGPVAFGGRGEFDGRMTGPFRRPRVEGLFSGDGLWAWDTLWGNGAAQIVVENSYVTVTDGTIRHGDSEIRAEGLFSLGYPRRDQGEEINARIRVAGRDLTSLRHAFDLDDWPVTGQLTGEFHLAGAYQAPVGFGAMTIDDGLAYAETFEKATASLRFDGVGVRLDGITLVKTIGTVTGTAFVGWDGTYSFNADGSRIPVERTTAFAFPRAQPSGLIEFTASGSSTFAAPRYDVRFRMNDVYVVAEPVGQVTGTLALRGKEISGEFEVASPRLALTGTGRIGLDPDSIADLTFRFHDSSLDPYVRLFVPQLMPYTTAVASGSLHVTGVLTDVNHLVADATVDRVEMRLFDYAIRNAQPIKLALDQQVVKIEDLQLVGDDTRLTVGGAIALGDERIAVHAAGDANLGILQGFFSDVRGAGRAALTASVDGPLYQPVFTGSATITDGRIRHFSLPNALDAINGTIRFDSRGVTLDDVVATMGGGRVQFGGRIGLEGYLPGDLNVSVRGEDMHLRYPAGVRSTVDADLSVRGNVKTPTLAGSVTVKSAAWTRRIDPTGGLLEFGGRGSASAGVAPAPPPTVPVRFDIEVHVPSTLRVENNLARLVARAELQLRGTYERPLLFGRAEVERGEVTFEGRRYLVTHGNIDFTNPSRIEPFFDVEAETRVRVPGQTYQVTVRAVGTMERLRPDLSSDPPLPTADVLALLFSDARRDQNGPGNAELRALQNPNELQRDILTARATQMLANPVSSEVGRVVEQTFGVDAFQLTPSLLDPYTQSSNRVNPSARVTIGKRISERAYFTFSRSLSSSSADQILLLEYRRNRTAVVDPLAQRGFLVRDRVQGEALVLMIRPSVGIAWLAIMFAASIAVPAAADVSDYIARPVVSVTFEREGHRVIDPRLPPLVQTRVDQPLTVADVRASITHLFSLGQFEDVRVHASPSGTGIALVYELLPLHPVAGFGFTGISGLDGVDEGRLRRAIIDRFGSTPRVGRAADIARLVEDELRRRAYLDAHVEPAADIEHRLEQATLRFDVNPGPRTHIGTIRVEGTAGIPETELLQLLDVTPGSPYEPDRLTAGIAKYLENRRSRGFYEARALVTPVLTGGTHLANLNIVATEGPHVRLVFNGDPLPSNRRAELVPVAAEGSADDDLLEDSSVRIEEFLRGQGYRDAAAPYTRQPSGAELLITFTVKKGPQYRVARIDLVGNETKPSSVIEARVRIRAGQPFSSAVLNADLATIGDLYHRDGYANAQVKASVDPEPAGTGAAATPMAVSISITENVRTVVNSVSVVGNASVPEAELLEPLGLKPGQPFFVTQLAIDRDAMQLAYANRGYQSASIETTPRVSADGGSADIVFTVREGPRLFVDHLLIVGNERTRTQTVERELQFKSGDPLGVAAISESERRLAALGLFRSARITQLGHGDATRRDVLVTLEEAPVTTIGYGGGLEARQVPRRTVEGGGVATEQLEFAPRAFFEIGRRNLFGKNRSINLFTRVSLRPQDSTIPGVDGTGVSFSEYRVLGTFREPRVLGTAADALLSATLEQQSRSSFNFARRAFSAEIGRRLTPTVSVSGNYQIQRTELFDEKINPADKLLVDRLFPQVRLSSFSLSAIRDTRDDPLNPTRGHYTSANGELAARSIGSEVGFAKTFFTAQMFRIVPRTNKIVFAGDARLGMAVGFPRKVTLTGPGNLPILDGDGLPIVTEVSELPASERFFAGGDTTVRGFTQDRLGSPDTIDKDGFPIGGNALVIFNAEVRAPVHGGLGVVAFFDTGNVFSRTSNLDLTELRGSVGFGLRYNSPVGPIRFDLGFKLHPQEIVPGVQEGLTALHISFGQAF